MARELSPRCAASRLECLFCGMDVVTDANTMLTNRLGRNPAKAASHRLRVQLVCHTIQYKAHGITMSAAPHRPIATAYYIGSCLPLRQLKDSVVLLDKGFDLRPRHP